MQLKTEISPWGDNFLADFQSQLKETMIEKSPMAEKREKRVETVKKFFSESEIRRIQKIGMVRHRPSLSDVKKHKSVSLESNLRVSGSNPQFATIKYSRRLSNFAPIDQRQRRGKDGDIRIISQKSRIFLNMPISAIKRTELDQKQQFFSQQISPLQQNQTYLFSLCKKQQIRWQKPRREKSSQEERMENEEIFKRVEEISKKRKKQIKLPRISVTYSLQKIIQ